MRLKSVLILVQRFVAQKTENVLHKHPAIRIWRRREKHAWLQETVKRESVFTGNVCFINATWMTSRLTKHWSWTVAASSASESWTVRESFNSCCSVDDHRWNWWNSFTWFRHSSSSLMLLLANTTQLVLQIHSHRLHRRRNFVLLCFSVNTLVQWNGQKNRNKFHHN